VAVNWDNAARALARFFKRHRSALEMVPSRESQLLELASLMATVEHYRQQGYDVAPRNTPRGRLRIKVSASGYPWNFSYFSAHGKGSDVELHVNLAVRGASPRDPGYYVVDIAVVKTGRVPTTRSEDWTGVANDALVTFVEAKKLVIYPMLLAHFVGIAHELTPRFLRRHTPPEGSPDPHFFPTLLATGYFTDNARAVVESYPARRYWLNVVPDMDARISAIAAGRLAAPLGRSEET
jgi:hypothetical protein